ncbi:MAG: primosomal protein [Actinobacteria bacterium]|nr:primosomal protein [Actinomycetota bacterium]
MNADPRVALANLTASLERHLEASASRRGENDPTVVAAYQAVADAFDLYDDALLEAFGEVTPLEIYSGDDSGDDDGDDDGEDDGEDDGDEELDDHGDEDGDSHDVYLGLDDSDYDEEPSRTS